MIEAYKNKDIVQRKKEKSISVLESVILIVLREGESQVLR